MARVRTGKQLRVICSELGLRLVPGYVEKVVKGETTWVNGVGWRISSQRVAMPTAEHESLRAKVLAGEVHGSSAAMELSDYRAWSYQCATLWEVDSIVRLVEDDSTWGSHSPGAVTCVRGKPARGTEVD